MIFYSLNDPEKQKLKYLLTGIDIFEHIYKRYYDILFGDKS